VSTHETVLEFAYDSTGTAARVEQSVRPEVGEIAGDRTAVSMDRTDETLVLTVTATDLVALRAGVNTWLTLLGVAERSGGLTPSRD